MRFLLCGFIYVFFLVIPALLSAQHMIIDDAAVSEKNLFEGWAGTEESWIQPSVAVNRSWNVSPGIIFDTSNPNFNATNWLIENKVVPAGWSNDTWAVGNVSALVFDFDGNLTQFYSYIPLSRRILHSNSLIHLNIGFEGNQISNDWDYAITTGLRTDFAISTRIFLLSELYTFDFNSTGFQSGFRFLIIPGRLESDITYGRGFEDGVTFPGFNVGISFTPY